MTTIHKYSLPISDDVTEIAMPIGAQILTIQTQRNEPYIWAVVNTVNTAAAFERRRFRVHGTGHPVDGYANKGNYIGTFQLLSGDLVFHVFEVPSRKGGDV